MEEDKIIDDYKLVFGYDLMELTKFNDDILSFIIELALTRLDTSVFELCKSSKSKELEKSRSFLEDKFKVYDISYLDSKKLKKMDGFIISDVSELIDVYNRLGGYISPFDIPITYINKDPYFATLEQHLNICDDKAFLKKMRLYIRRICLSRKITNITGLSYTHEIVHALLSREKGIIRKFNNSEVLSIFLELVYCFEGSFSDYELKLLEIRRVNYLLIEFDKLFKYFYDNDNKQINKIEALISSKYVESIVVAMRLFIVYYEGSLNIKREILKNIQRVFDCSITLEEMLLLYDIDFYNIDNNGIIKHLLRK